MSKNLYKVLFAIFIISLVSSFSLQAQTVTGNVKDGTTGFSIPGVSVLEMGTINGTVTDIDGNFSLQLTQGSDTLEFSFMGYETLSLAVGGRQVIDVLLKEDLLELDEVVVIGYGTQKKKVVTGAISTVNAEEISKVPVLQAGQAMQGRTAGVQVTNQSGQPGDPPTIRIRGVGTTGNSDPLYVVDGLVVSNIEYLNPGDIEQMDVLKDAASAAIYGARAANGVVLITTKSGTKGSINLTYSTYYGIQNAAKKLDMLNSNEYMMMMNEGARNGGFTEPFNPNAVAEYDTDWQDAIFVQNAPMVSHDVSVAGGNDVATFSSSLSYFSQEGIIGGDKSKFERITARLNSRIKVTDWFNFGNNLTFSHVKRKGIASNSSFNGVYSSALNMEPLLPVFEQNPDSLAQPRYVNNADYLIRNSEGLIYGLSNRVPGEVVNPMALLEIQTGETRVDKAVGNVFGEIELIKGLKFKSSLGIDLAYVNYDSYRPLYYLNGAQKNINKTSVYKSVERYITWQWENTLIYTKSIKDHNFTILLGTSASEINGENLNGFNTMVPTDDPNNVYLDMSMDTAREAQAGGGAFHEAWFSAFARVTYDYKGKYAFTGIIRRDGSSKFGPNNRYGNFPSLGVSWLLSEESFMPDLGAINFLKLRASWGINGNDKIGSYQYLSVMDYSRAYIIGGTRLIGASPRFISNLDIRWEESEQIDLAIDLGVFDDRLIATFDYYIKNTNGLLERVAIPGHVGNDPPYANVGSVRNNGVELSTTWRHYIKGLKYSIGFNGSYNINTMTQIANDEKSIQGASWSVAGPVTRTEEGLPIAYFYGWETNGIFQDMNDVNTYLAPNGELLQPLASPGDVRFVDINGDGVIDDEDRTKIGNPTPDFTMGVTGSVEFKNFDFSFLLIGAFGHQIFNGSQRMDLQFTNSTTKLLDRWTGPGTSNTNPIYTWSDKNLNNRISDLYIENGDYVRVKNIQLGYSIPSNLLSKIKIKDWRIYVSAENLLTFTSYTGADPEIGAMSSFDIGIDRGIYPQARTFRFGTTITF